MADIAHISGLVIAGLIQILCLMQILLQQIHKTLRGPRGGLILCAGRFAEAIDKMVFQVFKETSYACNSCKSCCI